MTVEQLVRENLDLVRILARQTVRALGASHAVQVEDLESAGREGLFLAARGFDAARGVPFRRWANLRVKGAMYDALRQSGGLPRRVYRQVTAMQNAAFVVEGQVEDEAALPEAETPEDADEKLDEKLSNAAMGMAIAFLKMEGTESIEGASDEEVLTTEDLAARHQLVSKLRSLIAESADPGRTLLQRHYFAGDTFDDVAKELGLSKSWASRVHARAITDLAARMAA
jgi:RNA polymerase sigma factor FliA